MHGLLRDVQDGRNLLDLQTCKHAQFHHFGFSRIGFGEHVERFVDDWASGWVAERQLRDGQFGGGWGDDVEMWSWWTPVWIAFDDPVANAAQERLSSGIFQQPHLRDGFTSRVTDVEHSNEDTTDTILPMMHLRPDDPYTAIVAGAKLYLGGYSGSI